MFESHRFRAALLLSAVALWACSDDGANDPPADTGLPEFTVGDAQVSAEVRTAMAQVVADVGASSGAAADAELAGVLGAIGSAILGEGRITGVSGVTTSSALRTAPAPATLVSGPWGVFGFAVAVYPSEGEPLKAYYTGVVALNGTAAAIGIKKAETEPEVRNARADFPNSKARGLFFADRSLGWGAVAGYTQTIGKTEEGACAGVALTGILCTYGMASSGLEISESEPLSFSGNSATGSRRFALPYGDVRGYFFAVYCDQASFC